MHACVDLDTLNAITVGEIVLTHAVSSAVRYFVKSVRGLAVLLLGFARWKRIELRCR